MPGTDRPTRGSSRAATVLLVIGVSVTPIAALMIWFAADGGPLRAAATLAVLGTVLIGLSVVLRRDSDSVRIELEEQILAETDSIRDEVRSAVVTALQRSNQSLHAELAALQDQVDRLQSQLAAPRRQPGPVSAPPSRPMSPPPSRPVSAAPTSGGRRHRHAEDDDEPTGYGYHSPEYMGGAPSYTAATRRRHRAED